MLIVTKATLRVNGITAVRLEASVPMLGRVVVDGVAEKDRVDRVDREVGDALAYGRALERLGRMMQRRAMGVVKHRDDMREQRVRQVAANQSRQSTGLPPLTHWQSVDGQMRRVSWEVEGFGHGTDEGSTIVRKGPVE